MADTQNNDDQFVQNPGDDTNPMADMAADEKLPQDNDPPFSPPDGVQDRVDADNQLADNQTNIDDHEHYDAGLEAATGADLPGEAADENPEPGERIG
jgi:hypothetical protein